MNRWSPDTCKCVFDFEPDSNDGSNQILVGVVNTCLDHSGLSGKILHQTVLKSENQKKNILHGKLLALDDMAEEVVQDDGNIVRKFKKGKGFDWSFTGKDDQRILNVTTKGYKLTDAQKNNIGNGKVVIQ